jgi:hypothetical protein
MKGMNDQKNVSLEWMDEKMKGWMNKNIENLEWLNGWTKEWKGERKEERKEWMNEPKEWDFGKFRKVKFEMMNLCKVGIGKMSTSYLPLSNAMTRKTNGHIFSLSSSLFLQK